MTVQVVEHDPFKYYADQDAGKRAYLPINEWTWGRQENGIFIAQIAYASTGFRSLYNEKTDALVKELSQTLDEPKQLALLAEIEDEVLRHHWIVPSTMPVRCTPIRIACWNILCRNLAHTSWT